MDAKKLSVGEVKKALASPPPYQEIRDRAERTVTKWRWATAPLVWVRPYEAEIDGEAGGKWLSKAPKDRDGFAHHGFDESDQLVALRSYNEFADYDETLYVRDAHAIWQWEYSANDKARPEAVGRFRLEDGHLADFVRVHRNGYTILEQYDADEHRRLVRVRRKQSPGGASSYSIAHVGNTVVTIKRGTNVIYRRPTKPLVTLARELRRALVTEIKAMLSRAKPRDELYGVLLAYDAESYDGMLPPTVVLARSAERAKEWDAQALSTFDDPRFEWGDGSAALQLSVAVCDHLRAKGDTEPARKLLIDVAKDLMRSTRKLVRATKEYVVLPIDLEGAHVKKNLRAIRANGS